VPHEPYRAGAYRLGAFHPAPLPPSPAIRMDAALQRQLGDANLALGRLDGAIQTLPNPGHFVLMYIRKEAVLSSQIEGTQSSLTDLLAAEAEVLADDAPRDVDEVVNYINALNYGLKRLDTLPVSVRLVREIHERLLAGVRGGHLSPGALRTTQNWIGPMGATQAEATFVPPPPQEVGGALADLERFLHAEDDTPFLVKVGLAHAQFETIHPFLDGNGRVGRLLITLLLCERQVLQKPVLYLSYWFKANRATYYDRLQAVRDAGDWEGWLDFFLTGVATTATEATATARRIIALREEDRTRITDGIVRVAGNGLKVLERLYQRPVISVKEVQEMIGTTYPAANDLVSRLEALGILREITGWARNRRYMYDRYVQLFTDGGR
jgi:Fic family protein